jgi:AcrR family transcriptional regulator
MAKATRGLERREDALSRERIVDAAIELLDGEGENGLTFRALATRLATGPGAIYWHIASKSELLVAASDAVVARALDAVVTRAAPPKTIRSIAVAIFEAIDAHPWVGAQLSGPAQTALLLIFERIGRQIQALGVIDGAQFTAASALVNYVIGVSVQNAANRSLCEPETDRADFLEMMSARWKALDAHEYPFLRNVATQLREHDDRAEFLAGIDLILTGVGASGRRVHERRAASGRAAKAGPPAAKCRSR